MYPSPAAKKILRQWAGSVRYTYNLCKAEFDRSGKASLKHLRETCENRSADIPGWLHDTPYDVRDSAVREFSQAVSNGFRKFKATGQKFSMSFRSRKAPQQTFDVGKKHWNRRRGVFSSILSSKRLRQFQDRYKIPSVLPADSKLSITRTGQFWLNIPTPVMSTNLPHARVGDSQARDGDEYEAVASIDPGVRTFATVYTGSHVIEWGTGSMKRITHHAMYADRLRSRRDKAPTHRIRYRLTRALLRATQKVRNLVSDLHHKFSRWLCDTFDTILLPVFDTSRMVLRSTRRLHRKTVRMMCTLSHFTFRKRLLDKVRASGDPDRVRLVSEAYTSKTCGNCGALHHKLGGNKRFLCPSCSVAIDRDANGARNILLRNLLAEESPATPPGVRVGE